MLVRFEFCCFALHVFEYCDSGGLILFVERGTPLRVSVRVLKLFIAVSH